MTGNTFTATAGAARLLVDGPLGEGWSDLHVRLLTVRRARLTPQWTYADTRSAFWRLYVNDRSGAVVESGGKRHALRPWRAYLVPAWVRFRGLCQSDRIMHHYAHFDLVGVSATLVQEAFPAPLAVRGGPAAMAVVRQWAREMTDAPQPTSGVPALCLTKAAIYLCLRNAIEGLPHTRRERLTLYLHGRRPVLPAIEHVERNFDRPPRNVDLAALCGVGPDHFVRLFKRCVGQTPARYGLDRRLAAAALRLVLTDDSIEQIAADTGFADRFHFSRAFATGIGTPPAAYRRAGRHNQ